MEAPLFTKPKLPFVKVATASRLEKEAEEWPAEIVGEAYRQLPFLRSFETDLELQRVDAARGYAVGRLLVYPARMEKQAALAGNRLVAVPVIVREREMAPLDVYSHRGTWHPLDERKVQEVLFQPGVFDRSAPVGQFGATDISHQMWPPGNDMRYSSPNTIEKSSSARSLWKTASATFRQGDVEAFKERLRKDDYLRFSFLGRDELRPFVEDLVEHKEVTASDIRGTRQATLKPTVVQFVESGNGYLIKTANHKCFSPTEQVVSRFEVEKVLSKEAMAKLTATGRVTLVVDPAIPAGPAEKTAQAADRLGVYETCSGTSRLEGVVVPRVVSLEGKPLDLQVFAGPTSHAMQEKVAGIFKEDVILGPLEPHGKGVFVYQTGPMAVATEPVEVLSRVEVTHGKEKIAGYVAKRLTTGEDLRLDVVPGLKKLAQIGQGHYALPTGLVFMPIEGKQVRVADSPEHVGLAQLEKVASRREEVILHSNDPDNYWLSGANAHDAFAGRSLDRADAEFALGALGVAPKQMKPLMEKAASEGRVTIPHSRAVLPEEALQAAFLVKSAGAVKKVPDLRVDLVKEASVLIDKETCDAILSLGFVTPENVAVYVDYLPELEKVSSRLAEILVASRLGMDDVKESAAKNALTQLSTVIEGLREVQAKIQ